MPKIKNIVKKIEAEQAEELAMMQAEHAAAEDAVHTMVLTREGHADYANMMRAMLTEFEAPLHAFDAMDNANADVSRPVAEKLTAEMNRLTDRFGHILDELDELYGNGEADEVCDCCADARAAEATFGPGPVIIQGGAEAVMQMLRDRAASMSAPNGGFVFGPRS